ncbi:hypothetical protein PMAYCL1PPCAC_14535, partial [Pristionchus mayeri]
SIMDQSTPKNRNHKRARQAASDEELRAEREITMKLEKEIKKKKRVEERSEGLKKELEDVRDERSTSNQRTEELPCPHPKRHIWNGIRRRSPEGALSFRHLSSECPGEIGQE